MLPIDSRSKVFRALAALCVLTLAVGTPPAQSQDETAAAGQDESITVSLDVENVNVREVIRGLAQQGGANIAISDSVQGTITLSMTDVPWREAFNAVLKIGGLVGEYEGNLIMVRNIAEFDPASGGGQQRSGMISKVFSFEFADAASLEKAFKAMAGPGGEVALDETTNSLIVADTAVYIGKLAALAAEIDAPPRKVLIEVLIADTILSDEKDIGINWEAVKNNGSHEWRLGQELIDTAGGGGTVTYNVLDGRWTAENFLRALQQFKNSRVLATPKILVLSGREAKIETIEEIPYQELSQTSSGGQIGTTAFKEAGVKLKVTPKVTDDGRIFLTVEAEQSATTGERVNDVPVINSRKADTTLLLTDNETLVIGGLRRKEMVKNVTQVPLLGDIPLLGALFRYTDTLEENRDLVIFLTPRIQEQAPPFTEKEREAMDEIGFPKDSHESVRLELESKVNGMAKDIQEGDLAGIRDRIDDLCNRLQHDD